MRPVWEVFHDQPPENLVLVFGYPMFMGEFKKSATALGVPQAVPYQARHSGPIIDLALRRRDLMAKKRGRWRTDHSVRRSAAQRAHFNRSEELVKELILGWGNAQLPLTVQWGCTASTWPTSAVVLAL